MAQVPICFALYFVRLVTEKLNDMTVYNLKYDKSSNLNYNLTILFSHHHIIDDRYWHSALANSEGQGRGHVYLDNEYLGNGDS